MPHIAMPDRRAETTLGPSIIRRAPRVVAACRRFVPRAAGFVLAAGLAAGLSGPAELAAQGHAGHGKAGGATGAAADTAQAGHAMRMGGGGNGNPMRERMQRMKNGEPVEAGQSAFAAVAEVVRLLEADPNTNWSRVNLDALRDHLRDMDRVMMHAEAAAEPVDGGVRLVVTGDGEVRAAIRRMLHMHAGALEGEMPVTATPSHHDEGIVLTVLARDPVDVGLVARLRGLGFAGLLARGAHHQRHHLAIAKGEHGAGAHGQH
jgi:hypothetical protein